MPTAASTPYAITFDHAAPRMPYLGTRSRLATMAATVAAPVTTG